MRILKTFFRHPAPVEYDKQNKIPAVRSSICTGEKIAGFKDKNTGHFEEVMLINSDADLAKFKKMYGVDEVTTIY